MKRIVRLPVFAGGIVMVAVLASFLPNTTSRVDAQVTGLRSQSSRYYTPYGQGRYGRYGQGYGYRGTFGRRDYGHSGYGITPYRYGNSYGYGNSYYYGSGSYIRSYGGSAYYQPYGQIYGGRIYFGYGGY